MIHGLTRREFAIGSGAALLSLRAPSARAAAADSKTLRFIAQSDLRVLDPIWTTAYITRNHGYMVFDTLFALDDKFRPHPQMVGDFKISADKLVYGFTLRDGLKFHDGQPVRGDDCVASLRRWMARDSFGQTLATEIAAMTGGGGKTFSIKLKRPFPLLIEALAKVSSLVPFIMPERLAKTDPFKQITEMVGSGPFKFVKGEFQPGNKVVYVKNTDYLPRKEPPIWASGGKVVKVDRVEWLYVPDHTTAAASLNEGEVDWWENPPLDLVPVFAGHPVTVADADPLGSPQMVRFNHLYPPFDNVKMRQAVLAVTNQADFMTAIAGDPKNWVEAPSFFTWGTPMASKAGSEALTGKRDFAKAKQMVKEAGYKGEKVVVLDATDLPGPHEQALVVADLMKKLGLNVEIQAMDWGQLVTRRASTKPIGEGGWNVFGTGWIGADMLDPTLNQPLRCNGKNAWFGWPSDDRIEALRDKWIQSEDLEDRQAIAAQIQKRAFEVVPYVPTGQYTPKTAYRKNLKGVIPAPVFLMWNVEKA
ncbi:MAG TPA: ABC transporter substrate-binding protein [Stellaceae bacterium]|nr:ABC transporter substrate-binding protein [Stellaceae bacterium]